MNWGGIVILAVLAACALFIIGRIWRISSRRHSFRTMLRVPGSNWRRGFACYGAMHMAWYSLVRFSTKPDLVFSRTGLAINGTPVHDRTNGTTLVTFANAGREYELLLSTGDYNGLLSWLGSVPPRESARY